MRRGVQKFTLDVFGDDGPPVVGQAYRSVSAAGRVAAYYRVTSIRQVQVRVSRGEKSRWRLTVERLPGKPAEEVSYTVETYPRKPKRDRFSPLL